MSALGADEASESVYAQTKARGEAAVREVFPDAAVVRPSIVFGAEDGFFNLFASLTSISPFLPVIGAPFPPRFTDGKLDLFGDGGPKMQPVFVGDVAEAMAKALTETPNENRHAGKTYALGGPTVYSFADLMRLVLSVTGRKRLLLPVPYFAAEIQAAVLQFLPKPLLTPDQVTLLKTDNVVPDGAPGLADLGIAPTAAEAVIPTYLRRFMAPGREDALA
jgi:uncharacterized protein YbjT (DUF2867 family)